MTELAFAVRMATQLGLRNEPIRNRVKEAVLEEHVLQRMMDVLSTQQRQKAQMGGVKTQAWLQLVPWTSLN
ncbi:MAG: hypothetical protein QE263_06970 [Vampirovibrionales bacterium]|nr:hypothetical protein [Vampirovibrionales bacterium]